MKKPKIYVYPKKQSVIVDGLSVSQTGEAYGDMIDALIESIEARKSHLIEWGLYTHEEMIGDEVYRNQYNALKKAGVTEL